MFDRIPFRLMPKASRTFLKFLLALVFFTLPNLVPQGASASSGDTLSVSASGAVSSGSLTKVKSPLPHLVQTGLRAEHNLPEEILGIEARYPGARVSTVALIYDDYGTGTDTDFRRTVTLL